MTIQDVLIGTHSVTVKREGRESDIEFEKVDEETILGLPEIYDDSVVTALREEGFEFESQFPLEFNYYIHDEAEPYDCKQVSEELGLSEDSELVRRIANIGYEIEVTIRVSDQHTYEITHVFGQKLETPKSYSV